MSVNDLRKEADLHSKSSETKIIEFEETYEDLVILVHRYGTGGSEIGAIANEERSLTLHLGVCANDMENDPSNSEHERRSKRDRSNPHPNSRNSWIVK